MSAISGTSLLSKYQTASSALSSDRRRTALDFCIGPLWCHRIKPKANYDGLRSYLVRAMWLDALERVAVGGLDQRDALVGMTMKYKRIGKTCSSLHCFVCVTDIQKLNQQCSRA